MKRVLIIEDDVLVAKVYEGAFRGAGFEVDVATDGQSGLQHILQERPDGVLLDLMLPQLNGLDILKKIRTQREFDRVPIVAFTNSYVTQVWEDAKRCGASKFFHKSQVRPRDIVDAMNEVLAAVPAVAPATAPAPAVPSLPVPVSQAPVTAHPSATVPAAAVPPPRPGLPPSPRPGGAPSPEAPTEMVRNLLPAVPGILNALQSIAITLPHQADETARRGSLLELYRKLHSFSGICGMAGLRTLADLATALEAMVIELHQDPARLNPSTCKTVVDSCSLLHQRFNPNLAFKGGTAERGTGLVLDDDLMSRRAAAVALQKAGFEVADMELPQNAMDLLQRKSFDLMVVGGAVAESGFEELLARIRSQPTAAGMALVCVLPLAEFVRRPPANPDLGLDCMGRPFPMIELAVKGLAVIARRSGSAPAARGDLATASPV